MQYPQTQTHFSEAANNVTLFWAYAASFGAAWGSLEVLIGSFLHALHIPFAGAMLAATGAALLVAERQVLNARGLCLVTGVVAASCKSLSPGGVILGPMIGIITEAAFVEAVLLFGATRYSTAMVAGVFAVLWSLAQKVLVQVLFYGGDVIALWIAAVSKASTWVGVAPTAGWSLMAGIAALLAAIGATAGAIGLGAGSQCRPHHPQWQAALAQQPLPIANGQVPSQQVPPPKTSIHARRFLLPVAIACIALQFPGRLSLSVAGLGLWIFAAALCDREALARLWMPRFLGVTAIVALASGLLLGSKDASAFGIAFSSSGLYAGASMTTRGILVFAITSWASCAIMRDEARQLRRVLHNENLAAAILTAVRLIPALTEHLQSAWGSRQPSARQPAFSQRRLRAALVELVCQAAGNAEAAAQFSKPSHAGADAATMIGSTQTAIHH